MSDVILHYWSVRMRRDGTIESDWKGQTQDTEAHLAPWNGEQRLYVGAWVRDREEAIRLANRERERLIAEDKWPKGEP